MPTKVVFATFISTEDEQAAQDGEMFRYHIILALMTS